MQTLENIYKIISIEVVDSITHIKFMLELKYPPLQSALLGLKHTKHSEHYSEVFSFQKMIVTKLLCCIGEALQWDGMVSKMQTTSPTTIGQHGDG